MIRLFALSVFCSFLITCASTKQYTLEDLPAERFEYSFGGGFTGEYQEYMLLPNGQLFYRKKVVNELPWRAYESLDSKVTKELYATFKKQSFANLGYDDPGNMTYTIKYHTDGEVSTLTWGGIEQKPSEELKTYWRRVMSAVSEKKRLVSKS